MSMMLQESEEAASALESAEGSEERTEEALPQRTEGAEGMSPRSDNAESAKGMLTKPDSAEGMLPQGTVETSLSQAISRLEKGYDAEVKNFLCEKQILARILKSCVEEFRDCCIEDIAEKYIEGSPQISETAVDRDVQDVAAQGSEGRDAVGGSAGSGSKIIGAANEDRSVSEGLVTYDIRFTATAPGTGEPIRLIINVEAQRRLKGLSYPLVKRGLYYCSRLISAQKNVEFKGTHYENIRKVYSIWICQNVPEDRQHSIVQYDISERVISSLHPVEPEEKQNYDLMTVMMLGLGDPFVREADDVLRMLSIALSPEIDAEQKKRMMSEEFGISMTEAMERSVSNMCNLSYNITEEAEARGKQIQLYELVHEGLLSLRVGADKADQTEAEFQAGMDAYYVNAG